MQMISDLHFSSLGTVISDLDIQKDAINPEESPPTVELYSLPTW